MRRLALVRRFVKARPKRRYDSRGRQAGALETRRRIVSASRRLFLDRGYAATTMDAIAKAAGVSVETIYLSIGGKPSLVRYLIETALSGTDEPVPPLRRKGVSEIRAEANPRHRIKLFAQMARQVQERLAPIWQVVQEAAPSDQGLQQMVSDLLRRHVRSMGTAARHLAGGHLRKGVSVQTARDVLWAMNSTDFYRLLVIGRGWSGEAYERWLADAWQRLLLE